jgi:hypothetical protein
MSIESITIAFHHSKATGTAKLVLLGIANHDGDGGAWPSLATLRKYAGGIDRRNVRRAVDRLEQLGEVRRIIQGGGDHNTADERRPNLYKFLLTCPHDCDRTTNHRTSRSVETTFEHELFTGGAITPPGGDSAPGTGGDSAPQTTHLNLIKQLPSPTIVAREEIAIKAPTCTQGHELTIEGRYCLYGCPTKTFLEEIQAQQ